MIGRLAIIAPGLLGGSVAMGARHHAVAKHIVIWARRPDVRLELKSQPWCDSVAETPEAAVAGADLVVVCSFVDTIVSLIERFAGSLSPGSIVTDVGSVKGAIVKAGDAAVRHGSKGKAFFVGSHPMAGSQKNGWQHGTFDLFEDRTCFVTPLEETDPGAVKTVTDFWQALGANTYRVSPAEHDLIVAHISHLPQLIASTLSAFLAGEPIDWRNYAGNGLRDTIRIAGSDPELWKTIFERNQSSVLAALRGFQRKLAATEEALADHDWEAIAALMSDGKKYREGF